MRKGKVKAYSIFFRGEWLTNSVNIEFSIEDPFADTDFASWKRFNAEFGNKVQIIGDDLFTTNIERIKEGIKEELADSVLIKLNQVGTVTETIEAIRLTQEAGWLFCQERKNGEVEREPSYPKVARC